MAKTVSIGRHSWDNCPRPLLNAPLLSKWLTCADEAVSANKPSVVSLDVSRMKLDDETALSRVDGAVRCCPPARTPSSPLTSDHLEREIPGEHLR